MKTFQLALLAAFLVTGISVVAFSVVDDPISGTWIGDWGPSEWDRNQVTVELKWDGKSLTGTVNPGPNAVELKKTMFDAKNNSVHFEADVVSRRGGQIHYVIDGKAEKGTMTGSWSHDNLKGDFKIKRK
jgi:hypothetical protein